MAWSGEASLGYSLVWVRSLVLVLEILVSFSYAYLVVFLANRCARGGANAI